MGIRNLKRSGRLCLCLCGAYLGLVLALCPGLVAASAFTQEFESLVTQRPKYTWGGSESVEKGLDCSGIIYRAARNLGLPIRRTTAERMYYGDGGWHGRHIDAAPDAPHGALIWWHVKEKRPYGHIGVVLRQKGKPDRVGHASSTKGRAVFEEWKGWAIDKMSGLKEIDILR